MKREADNNRVKRAVEHINAAITNLESIKWENIYGKEKKMTREEKQLLLVDLCARLPYYLQVKTVEDNEPYTLLSAHPNKDIALIGIDMGGVYATSKVKIDIIKPYLRPMSSMTEEEDKEFALLQVNVHRADILYAIDCTKVVEWLNKHHFDYRGLIGMGLAISTEEFNPY